MEQCILVIDANPAVQAIASLALSHTGIAVKTLSSGERALEIIENLKPEIVICANEIQGCDPLDLCKSIKGQEELENTGFVILAAGSGIKSLRKKAERAGVDEILAKPFKSDQLRSIVLRVIARNSPEEMSSSQALLVLDASLLQKTFQLILKKRGVQSHFCDHPREILASTKASSFKLCVLEWTHEAAKMADSLQQEQLGELIIVTDGKETIDSSVRERAKQILHRPLSYEDVDSALRAVIPDFSPEERHEPEELDASQHASLAARVSASIFEILITQPALRFKNWSEACELATKALMTTCEDLHGSSSSSAFASPNKR